MNIEQLDEKLKGWRKARSIDENSTAEAQMACYDEEREELKDALGDMVVTLLNARAMGYSKTYVQTLLNEIDSGAAHLGVEITECLEMAWSEIEHRVGLVRSTGKFTKFKDLTHEERVKVALSGQLIKAPKEIVDACKLLCTGNEWDEIRAAEQSIADT